MRYLFKSVKLVWQPILGEMVKKNSELDTELNTKLKSCSYPEDKFEVVIGNTMCSWDFYEGI